MRHSIRGGALALAGCLALACSKSKTDEPVETTTEEGKSTSPSGVATDRRGTTLVRVVNALPGKARIDIVADDRVVFSSVAYQDVTDYQELRENVARFAVRHAGKDSTLADNREVMGDGARYTIIALPEPEGGARLRVLRDELVTDPARTQIRLVNAAPGTEAVSVVLQGREDPLFDGVQPGIEAGYKDIDPTTTTLVIKGKSGAPLLRVDKMKLEPGRAYTLVLTGATGKKLEAIRFDDREIRAGEQVSLRP